VNHGIFASLIYNTALLLALGLIFDAVTLSNNRYIWWHKILTGLCLGVVAIAIMVNPWILKPGIVFDTRSILLSLTGMFFGAVPAIIAASIAAFFRILQGGAGVYMGVSVVIASVCWGYVWKRLHHKWKRPYSLIEFYLLGVVTHITMMSLTVLLPSAVRLHVFNTIVIPVMLIYPLATVALGQILVRRIQLRRERLDLEYSEKQFRNLYENAPMAYQSLDERGNFITVNKIWTNIMGYSLDEIIGKNFSELIPPDYQPKFAECFAKFKASGHVEDVEYLFVRRDSSHILVAFFGTIVYDEDGKFKQTQCVFSDITDKRKVEQTLAQSEEKYRLLSETAQDIILVHHFDGSVSYANQKALDFLSVTRDELATINIIDYVAPEYLSLLDKHARERHQGFLGSRVYPLELISKDQVRIQVEVSSTPILADNKIIGILAVIRDITERIADQLAIKESQERFKLFMDNLPGGAFIKDSLSTILFVNKYLINVHNADDKIGKKPHGVYPEEIANAIITEDQQTIKNGYRTAIEEIIHNDGVTHLYETTKFVLPNPKGEPLIGGIALDVTKKIIAEEQRNRYAHRLELLRKIDSIVLDTLSFDSVCIAAVQNLQKLIPFMVLTVNVLVDGKVSIHTLCKPDDTFHYLNSDMNYLPNSDFITELINSKTIIINDVSIYPPPPDMPIRAALINDGIQSFMYNAMLMKDELVGFLWFSSAQKGFFTEEYREIADEFANQLAIVLHHLQLIQRIKEHATELEQKVDERTKQLSTSNQELEAFSYSVAHDLRAPLRTIDGYCTIIIEDYASSLNDKVIELLNTIRTTSNRMDTLIKELLQLAKLTRNAINYCTVNMHVMASNICREMLESKAPLIFDIIIDELPDCQADHTLINQVWHNILENAIKFTLTSSERRIQIGYQKLVHDTVYFVQDSGVGFNMEYVNKIFDPFQRLHRDHEFEGTGIGLAIVKKIIERHNGEVRAESIIGKGSTVYFSLPDVVSKG
jgi:PAS domain S-box-containing protein